MTTTNHDAARSAAADVTKPLTRREKNRAFIALAEVAAAKALPTRTVPASVIAAVTDYDEALNLSLKLAAGQAPPHARDDADALTDAAERRMVEAMDSAGIKIAIVGNVVAVAFFGGKECPESGNRVGGVLFSPCDIVGI